MLCRKARYKWLNYICTSLLSLLFPPTAGNRRIARHCSCIQTDQFPRHTLPLRGHKRWPGCGRREACMGKAPNDFLLTHCTPMGRSTHPHLRSNVERCATSPFVHLAGHSVSQSLSDSFCLSLCLPEFLWSKCPSQIQQHIQISALLQHHVIGLPKRPALLFIHPMITQMTPFQYTRPNMPARLELTLPKSSRKTGHQRTNYIPGSSH